MAWIPVVIWVADRILRSFRTLSFNRRFWNTKASVNYDPSSNIIRLTVPCSFSLYTPQPGTFYYIHVLGDKRFWESHPFTMAYLMGPQGRRSKGLSEHTPLIRHHDDEAYLIESDTEDGKPTMTFLIRPYDSFTSRLRDAASSPHETPLSLRVLVEGPYGRTLPFLSYEHLLFVVGGSGVVVPMAYLRSLVSDSRIRSIRIVWAVREPALAEDVLSRDLRPFIGAKKLFLKICMTQGRGYGGNVFSEPPAEVRVQYGRPDVRFEIEGAMVHAASAERIAVVACGPARMADDARRIVVDVMGPDGPRVDYFEESFQW